MRTAHSLGTIATAYTLGAVWLVVMLGVAAYSFVPMSRMYETVGIEIPVVAAVGTMTLGILVANAATALAWVVIRRSRKARIEQVGSHG
jgi:hypothetical protein